MVERLQTREIKKYNKYWGQAYRLSPIFIVEPFIIEPVCDCWYGIAYAAAGKKLSAQYCVSDAWSAIQWHTGKVWKYTDPCE